MQNKQRKMSGQNTQRKSAGWKNSQNKQTIIYGVNQTNEAEKPRVIQIRDTTQLHRLFREYIYIYNAYYIIVNGVYILCDIGVELYDLSQV